MWHELGVNKSYIKKMSVFIIRLEDPEKIKETIKNEKQQMKSLKSNLIKINKEIKKNI